MFENNEFNRKSLYDYYNGIKEYVIRPDNFTGGGEFFRIMDDNYNKVEENNELH